MGKEMSYKIGSIGTVLFLVTTICMVVYLLRGGDFKTISTISYVLSGLGFCLGIVPLIFGHLPRKKTGNLDFPYHPPRIKGDLQDAGAKEK